MPEEATNLPGIANPTIDEVSEEFLVELPVR